MSRQAMAFLALLVIISASCQKKRAKVVVVDYSTSIVKIERPYRPHFWRAYCEGTVNNVSEKVAYNVTMHAYLSCKGHSWYVERLISKVNLQPAEVGWFHCSGDSVPLNGASWPPDSAVHASVTAHWED